MEIIGIFAVDQHNGIGKDGTIPWHVRADFIHFKQTTMNNITIMGSNTYYDLRDNYSKNGNVLPGRDVRVVSRKDSDGNIFFDQDLQELINDLIKHHVEQCFIIGGAQLLSYPFKQKLISRVIISRISGVYDCDVVLPLDFSDNEKVRIENCCFNITKIIQNTQFDIVYANMEHNNE